jgi:hypothetical protein
MWSSEAIFVPNQKNLVPENSFLLFKKEDPIFLFEILDQESVFQDGRLFPVSSSC